MVLQLAPLSDPRILYCDWMRIEPRPAGPYRSRDEQHSSEGEPRVPEDETPVGLQGAHIGAKPGGVRGEKYLQRKTSQQEYDPDNG